MAGAAASVIVGVGPPFTLAMTPKKLRPALLEARRTRPGRKTCKRIAVWSAAVRPGAKYPRRAMAPPTSVAKVITLATPDATGNRSVMAYDPASTISSGVRPAATSAGLLPLLAGVFGLILRLDMFCSCVGQPAVGRAPTRGSMAMFGDAR